MNRISDRCRIGVDVGGTFTDAALETAGSRFTSKVLTTPGAPEEAVFEAMGSVLSQADAQPQDVEVVIHGTTLATNALIERTGATTALITTEGFRDVVEMGSESRFDQYDLNIVKPAPLVPRRRRFTVRERIGATGELLIPLDERGLLSIADSVRRLEVESAAIAFLHSFAYPGHERRAAAILEERLPGVSISLSSEVSPEIREYERFSTTCANAYVKPMMGRYLSNLEGGIEEQGFDCPLYVMLSGGTLADVATACRFPVRLVESGPAGGAVFAASVARRHGLDRVISFDMGGTTAKLCLIDDGQLPTARGFEAARAHRFKRGSGLPLSVPVAELTEIGAGGGSIAHIDRLRRIAVGPESAGAVPGPACYARGGVRATVTDANLCLGRLAPDRFASGSLTLRPDRATAAVDATVAGGLGIGVAEAAAGIVEIVDENMANAAREHATERGRNLRGRTLVAMGGCAPLHAAHLARKLGIDRIIVPASAGVGSALGFLRAPVAYEIARTVFQRLSRFAPEPVNSAFEEMAAEAHRIVATGAPDRLRNEIRRAYMRYVGQGHEIPVDLPCRPFEKDDGRLLKQAFAAAYQARYGRLIEGMDVEMLSWSVSVAAQSVQVSETPPCGRPDIVPVPAAGRVFDLDKGDWSDMRILLRASMPSGDWFEGPGLIAEDETATFVPNGYRAQLCARGDIIVERANGEPGT